MRWHSGYDFGSSLRAHRDGKRRPCVGDLWEQSEPCSIFVLTWSSRAIDVLTRHGQRYATGNQVPPPPYARHARLPLRRLGSLVVGRLDAGAVVLPCDGRQNSEMMTADHVSERGVEISEPGTAAHTNGKLYSSGSLSSSSRASLCTSVVSLND
jgi:hypothetical protein